MYKPELVYWFVREIVALKHFHRVMLPGLINYAKRHKFQEPYTDGEFQASAEEALQRVKRMRRES